VAPKPPSAAKLLQLYEQLEEQRDEASQRLKLDLAEIRKHLDALAATQLASNALINAPIDVDKMRFSARVVVALVAGGISIAVGIYASTYGLRSDVRDILTTMESQKQLEDVNQKLTDERSESLRKSIDAIDRRQQLQQIEIQELKEMFLKQGAKP
jgi:hypothetical protein